LHENGDNNSLQKMAYHEEDIVPLTVRGGGNTIILFWERPGAGGGK